MSPRRPPGRGGSLAIVLHTHMPWVLGHGTWPFGEEWLWEAIASSYLPLLDLLDSGAPLTLSLTPVVADQLEAPQTYELCAAFLDELRPQTHQLDADLLRAEGRNAEAAAVELSAQRYVESGERWHEIGGDLITAFGQYAKWTSSATHEVLPLAAVDGAVRLQLESGIASQRRRFGDWNGGLWLPECAHAPWLDRSLAEAGVRSTIVDWTDVLGLGSNRNLVPHRSPEGPLLVPLDRKLIELVWSDGGYPSGPAYRDHHGLTSNHHKAWSNDGLPYDQRRAAEAVRLDAKAFVAQVLQRLAKASGSVREPLAVVAADTEFFGHWWHEGVDWLWAVMTEAELQGLEIERLDDALARRRQTLPAPDPLPVTTWGRNRSLETWSGPKVADLAWRTRRAELALRHAGRASANPAALRALLALQSSDWAFLADGERTGDYPRERADAHAAALGAAIQSGGSDPLEGLAPDLAESALFRP